MIRERQGKVLQSLSNMASTSDSGMNSVALNKSVKNALKSISNKINRFILICQWKIAYSLFHTTLASFSPTFPKKINQREIFGGIMKKKLFQTIYLKF